MIPIELQQFTSDQLKVWDEAARRFEALDGILTRTIEVDGFEFTVQFNPARQASTGAKVDAASIAARSCFLCAANRPAEQHSKVLTDDIELLVNPFPIFNYHFTLPATTHTPQSLEGRVGVMMQLANRYPGMALFYNGPRCGASAPDHFHYQMVEAARLPLLTTSAQPPFGIIDIVSDADDPTTTEHIIQTLPIQPGESEPRINILCTARADGRVRTVIIPRRRHRPDFYGTDPGQMLLSPASIDLAGVIITTRRDDYERVDADTIRQMCAQCCRSTNYTRLYNGAEPRKLRVGIVTANTITIDFGTAGYDITGRHTFSLDSSGEILADGIKTDETIFVPQGSGAKFSVEDAAIGIGFHWERRENQIFNGTAEIITDGEDNLVLINHVPIEEYLKSVISSEMKADAPAELLKAHAIISRSWVMAQIFPPDTSNALAANPLPESTNTLIKWYDRDNHTLFDVCADDHCQRYQGLGRRTTEKVAEAVDDTCGIVLTSDGILCDARFSKCCGGVTELYSSCWQDIDMSYLKALRDDKSDEQADISDETAATAWIHSTPAAFCNTRDHDILSRVLNNYDREDCDFYRWEENITAKELTEIYRKKGGPEIGTITDLKPLHRGPSGRITLLEIIGTKGTCRIGKELEIRRLLSTSHLKSSAFTVEATTDSAGNRSFRLRGAGWGHGVGLCQIGAAVMASEGYDYASILRHYYPGTELTFMP